VLTTRTFFRHFTDKRDVLFADTEQHERQLSDATAGAPAELAPLDTITAAIAGLDWREIAPRAVQRQRQMVIAASPELTERELIKLNALTAAFANGLQRRGTEEATALLARRQGSPSTEPPTDAGSTPTQKPKSRTSSTPSSLTYAP
jgi:AcrR family transcriptional regulator